MKPETKMKLMKLMAKKPKISDNEKQAKMSVLDELEGHAKEAMASKLPGLKKVTVAADSEEGLMKGLDKAEELLEGEESEEEDMEEMAMPEMSEEELDQKLAELMKMKEMLQAKKA